MKSHLSNAISVCDRSALIVKYGTTEIAGRHVHFQVWMQVDEQKSICAARVVLTQGRSGKNMELGPKYQREHEGPTRIKEHEVFLRQSLQWSSRDAQIV